MKEIQKITSFSNEKIKYISKLKDKKTRDKNNQFIIEGYREIFKAFTSGKIQFTSLFYSPECFLGENEYELITKLNISLFEVPKEIFEKISYRDRPDGLLAIANTPDFIFRYEKNYQFNQLIIIEGVEKPGNLGTILRTAEGAGISAVIVTDPRIDLFNPNIIRSSTGTLFTIPVYIAETKKLIPYLKDNKIPTISVTPESRNYYFNMDLTEKIALVFGSEQYGLSDYVKKNSDNSISIPMNGVADSLNLAMSVGILAYDIVRQNILKAK